MKAGVFFLLLMYSTIISFGFQSTAGKSGIGRFFMMLLFIFLPVFFYYFRYFFIAAVKGDLRGAMQEARNVKMRRDIAKSRKLAQAEAKERKQQQERDRQKEEAEKRKKKKRPLVLKMLKRSGNYRKSEIKIEIGIRNKKGRKMAKKKMQKIRNKQNKPKRKNLCLKIAKPLTVKKHQRRKMRKYLLEKISKSRRK
ncbi:hypothetical protein GQR36_23960 [Enterococcus termitis]